MRNGCDDSVMKLSGIFRGERTSRRRDFKAVLSRLVIMEGVLHDGPVVGLWRPDVGGGAQLAPGPLVVGAAAPPVAVRLLAERVGHGVGPEDTETLNQDKSLWKREG